MKQPDIVLLDEATSAVDTETELHIHKGFETLCKNRTTLVIAYVGSWVMALIANKAFRHRLSTVMRADCIVVIMDGQIVEQGDHATLIKQKGKYYDLWSKQVFYEPQADQLTVQDTSGTGEYTKSSKELSANGSAQKSSDDTDASKPEVLRKKLSIVSESHEAPSVKSIEGSDSEHKQKREVRKGSQ